MSMHRKAFRTISRSRRPAILATSIAAAFALCLHPSIGHAQSRAILVADAGRGTINEYDGATGALIIGGFSVGGLNGAYNLAIGGSTVYVSTNVGVSAFNASTGAAISSFTLHNSGISGMAVSGNILYVAAGSSLSEYNATTGALIKANFITGLNLPESVMISGNNLYIANEGTFKVGEYNATTGGAIKTNFVPLTDPQAPSALAIDGNTLYVGSGNLNNSQNGIVGAYSAISGAPIAATLATNTSFFVNNIAATDTDVYYEAGNTVFDVDPSTGQAVAGFHSITGFFTAEGIALSNMITINALGPNTVPNVPGAVVTIGAKGTSGVVAIAAAITNIDTLTQKFSTASTIDTSPGTLRVGITGGIFISSGSADLTIGTAPNSGTLTAGGSTANVAGTLTLGNNSGNLLTINSVIANNGTGIVSVTATGAGTTILAGVNTYTGATTLNGGTVELGTVDTAAAIVGTSAVSINSGGTLTLVNLKSPTFANAVTNGTGGIGTLEIDTADNTTLSGLISDGATGQIALTQSGDGTTILTHVDTYTGLTKVSSGILQVGTTMTAAAINTASAVQVGTNGGLLLVNPSGGVFNGNVENGLGGTGTLAFDSAKTILVGGTLTDGSSGKLALQQNGAGTTFLTNSGNTYSGPTDVSDGFLVIGTPTVSGSIGASSAVSVSGGGQLTIYDVVNDLLVNDVENGVGGLGSLSVQSTFTNTLSGTLTDGANGQLQVGQTGTGTTILTNAGNTYSGQTFITAGILQVGTTSTNGSIGATSVVTVGTGGKLQVVNIQGSELANDVTNGIGGAGTLEFASADTITASGALTNGKGTLALIQSGSGTTILTNGGNTYSGATTISDGVLQIGTVADAGSIGAASVVTIGDGTTLEVVNVSNGVLANAINAGTTGVGTLLINSANTNTLSGALKDGKTGKLAVTQSGTGTTILTSTMNAYSGPTIVSGGVLQVGTTMKPSSLGTAASVSVGKGGTLTLVNVVGNSFAKNVTNGLGGTGTLNVNSAAIVTVSGTLTDGVTDSLALTQSGTGMTIIINANNTYSGATTVRGGTLQIGTGPTVGGSIGANSPISVGTGGTLTLVNFGSNTFASNVTNGVGGNGTLKINSTGNITLVGTLSDGTGTLGLTQSGPAITVVTGTNSFTGPIAVTAGTLEIGNGSLGVLTGTGNATVSDKAKLILDLPATQVLGLSVALNGATATLNTIQSGAAKTTLSGIISGTGVLLQSGTGTTVLSGADTYLGATTVSAGTLEVDGSLAAASSVAVATAGTLTGTGTIGGKATLTGNGTINFGSTGSIASTLGVTGGNWSGTGSVGGVVTSSANTLTINGNLTAPSGLAVTGGSFGGTGTLTGKLTYTSAASSTFGGKIVDGAAASTVTMNKAGASLVLSGANTYTGATTITAGTLIVNGSLGTTAVTINSGGTLGGVGTIGGTVTDNMGGTITHGISGTPATLTVGGLILKTGAKINYQLGLPGVASASDLTDTVNLTLGGTLNISALFGFGTGTYDLINYTGTLTPGAVTFGTLPAGFTKTNFSISTATAGEVDLIVSGGPVVQYWDGATTTGDGTVHGGAGTWDNVTTNWTTSTGTPNAKWAQMAAVFNAGSGSVTIGDNITATVVGFAGSAGAYTLNLSPGKALTITGSGLTNTTAVTQNFVTTSAAGLSGTINFTNSATAGTLTQLTNNGGTASATKGGATFFKMTSTAGSAAIINQGSTVSGGLGGFTEFDNSASAGSATLTNNGGSGGGLGGGTYFTATSDGGTAQANTAGNGFVDISGLTGTGMKIGSIAGGGSYLLGKKILTVGGNNLTTSVSGVIADGGKSGGTGGALVKTGTGTLTLGGVNTYTGATTISMGTLEVDGSLAAASTVAVTTTGTLTGTGTVNGKATLTGNGVIDFGAGGTIGGTLAVTGGSWTGVGTVTGLVTSSAGVFTITDNLTATAGLALTGGSLAGTGKLTGSLTDTSSTSSTFAGVIAGAASAVTMNKASTTLTLTGSSTYGGATTVTAGTLQVGNGTTAGAALGTSAVTTGTMGTLTTDVASGETFSNSVTDNGHVIATGTTNNYNVSSVISGTGNLTKTGANTVTLTGNNTYKGGTVLTSGVLLVNNTAGSGTGSGAVTVNTGATLGGSGTIGGTVTLNKGGIVFPGAGTPGVAGTTLHAISMMWNGGGTLNLQLGAAGDELVLTGALTKGSAGAYTVNIADTPNGIPHTTFTLATFASTTFALANFTLQLPGNYVGHLIESATSLSVDITAGSGQQPDGSDPLASSDSTFSPAPAAGFSSDSDPSSSLNVTPTPEPGSVALLAFGGSALLGWRRRKACLPGKR